MSGTPNRVAEKPWGAEVIWASTPFYVGKLLAIEANRRLSLQYHTDKTETLQLMEGRVFIEIDHIGGGTVRELMEEGTAYTIAPMEKHRLTALMDSAVVEVSTPEVGTTVRLEDDYGRGNEEQ